VIRTVGIFQITWKWHSTGFWELIGRMSWGQEEKAITTSMSARSSTKSPAFDTVGWKQIVGAIVVIALDAQEFVAVAVAGGDDGIVDARRSVLEDGQDRPALVGEHHVAHLRDDMADMGPRMLQRHELMEIGGVEGPGVDDLGTMGIDQLQHMTLRHMHGLAAPRRNFRELLDHP
jgi:hypothetical protein